MATGYAEINVEKSCKSYDEMWEHVPHHEPKVKVMIYTKRKGTLLILLTKYQGILLLLKRDLK